LRAAVRNHPAVSTAVALVMLTVVVVNVRLFVVPQSDRPGPTDAVVVLGGPTYPARLKAALGMLEQYPGSVLVVSTPGNHSCPPAPATASKIVCFRPEPSSTQGEAQETARLAEQYGWKSLEVVTTADHVWRSRLRFGRCWVGHLRVVQAPTSVYIRVRSVPYEIAATVKAEVWQRGC
jgi:hypothetical protein